MSWPHLCAVTAPHVDLLLLVLSLTVAVCLPGRSMSGIHVCNVPQGCLLTAGWAWHSPRCLVQHTAHSGDCHIHSSSCIIAEMAIVGKA